MADVDVLENPFKDDMIDNDDDREEMPLRNLGDDDNGDMAPLQETTFSRIELKSAFIDSILKKYGGQLDSTTRALLRPQLTHEGELWYYNTEMNGETVKVRLTGRNGKLLARSTVERQKGGRDFFRAFSSDELVEAGVQRDIEDAAEDETNVLRPEDRRELGGVAKTLIPTSSKLKSALANVKWASTELEKARGELERAQTEEDIQYWEKEVQRFETLKILYTRARDSLEPSQISRLRTLLRNLGEDDRPLGDRLRDLFREEGVTIVSIVGAVIMTITALGLGIANAVKGVVKPSPTPSPNPPDKPTIRDRVREALKKLAGYLKELAKKGAAALPGLIGSIASFILRKAGEAIGYVAEHLWILVVMCVTALFGLITKKFSGSNKND